MHGFFPYFYVPAPGGFQQRDVADFKRKLSQQVDANQYNEVTGGAVLHVELMQRKTIYGYYGPDSSLFIKITVAHPKWVSRARGLLENGSIMYNGVHLSLQGFESNLSYDLRFMIDTALVGCNWVQVKHGNFTIRTRPTSHLQLEADCVYTDLISHAPEGEWSAIAPLRILSFDIECAGRKGVFPEAQHDPVI